MIPFYIKLSIPLIRESYLTIENENENLKGDLSQ